MALTRSLTLNDITATITIQNGSYPENVDWILKITDTNKNNASTYGAYAITKPVAKPEEHVAKPSITTQDSKHISRIKEMLDDVEKVTGKSNKAIYVCILFNYILNDALEFSKSYTKFTNTVIDKCYEMKKEVPDCVPLITLANKVLTALSAPIEKAKPVIQETKPVIQETKPVIQETKPDNNDNAEDKSRAELMKTILTKKGLTFDESTMAAYHDWEQYYNPKYPTNRYKKMCEFVKTLGAK